MLRVSEMPRKAAGALRGVSCTLRYEKGLERSVSCRNRKPEACLYPSFLALMQEKKQKKIKASGTPTKFGASRLTFLASVEATGAGEAGRAPI